MLLSFVPSLPIGAIKVTTVIVVATALFHQIYHACRHYPGLVMHQLEWHASLPTTHSSGYYKTPQPISVPSTTRVEQLNINNAFGACLLVKDDNELLYEWLAYHYTVLPLRYLVVGVDVNSTQDPQAVLQRWNKTDLTYWVLPAAQFSNLYTDDSKMNKEQNEKNRHHHELINRQKGFLTTCSNLLQQQGVRWTAYIDTDEFVVPNRLSYHDQSLEVNGKGHFSLKNESLLIRSKLPSIGSPDSTIMDLLNELQKYGFVNSCYTLPRLLVGALENRTCPEARSITARVTDDERNVAHASMTTLRFFQHAAKGDFSYSKFGKVFMDLSKISNDTIAQIQPRSIHRPYLDYCGPGVVHFPDSYFYLNHYIGGWERYISRADDKRRNRQEWEQRAFVDDASPVCESAIYEWLPRFIAAVGEPVAMDLLGIVAK